ncbi:multicopper oxidase family protein [Myxococcota bacterium]|nr:multicopper oxidase family protein [Myxococcota bacterium]
MTRGVFGLGALSIVVLAASALAACSGDAAPGDVQPPGWDEALRLTEAVDLDPDPAVVHVELVAQTSTVELGAGKVGRGLWTFSGSVPGPLIRARRGDRVRVDFVNQLPTPTTIHWHGVRVPIEMDGTPGASQPEVEPGERFTYDFVVPDAGLYWYHPHVDSAASVGFGLYGALLVSEPPGSVEDQLPADELVLVLSDVSLRADGTLLPADAGGELGTLFGREGETILVNGKVRPTLGARAGRAQRWRIVNAARSRYFQLELAGHTFTRIGGDGGRMNSAVVEPRILVIPGERADVLVTPTGNPGEILKLRWIPYDRGYGSTEYREAEDVLTIALDARPAVAPAVIPNVGAAIAPLDPAGAIPVSLHLEQLSTDGKLVLGINGLPSWDAPPIEARIGDTLRFDVTNGMDWAHPFHLHGFFFQVLDEGGAPRAPIEWKDTVDVPKLGQISVVARFDERPGMWMFHCHILDHADAGMMGMVHLQHPGH